MSEVLIPFRNREKGVRQRTCLELRYVHKLVRCDVALDGERFRTYARDTGLYGGTRVIVDPTARVPYVTGEAVVLGSETLKRIIAYGVDAIGDVQAALALAGLGVFPVQFACMPISGDVEDFLETLRRHPATVFYRSPDRLRPVDRPCPPTFRVTVSSSPFVSAAVHSLAMQLRPADHLVVCCDDGVCEEALLHLFICPVEVVNKASMAPTASCQDFLVDLPVGAVCVPGAFDEFRALCRDFTRTYIPLTLRHEGGAAVRQPGPALVPTKCGDVPATKTLLEIVATRTCAKRSRPEQTPCAVCAREMPDPKCVVPVVYINLARRADRKAEMEGELRIMGLYAERVDASLPPIGKPPHDGVHAVPHPVSGTGEAPAVALCACVGGRFPISGHQGLPRRDPASCDDGCIGV